MRALTGGTESEARRRIFLDEVRGGEDERELQAVLDETHV